MARLRLTYFAACLLVIFILLGFPPAMQAQEPLENHAGFPAVYPPPDGQPETPPFIVPFAGPPGPNTWFLGQPYGNTTGAFILREMFYMAGQGLHFGLDFAAPCGTEVVAIGDGVVVEIDTHGAPPHSVMIDHANGYSSLYGHLLETPNLIIGQEVEQGEVIALSGDTFETCRSAPHLHLEIRSNFHDRTYNPVLLIDADWVNLSLIGSFNDGFQRDLNNPRQWQHMDDQPIVQFAGPILNEYSHTWPPPEGDWSER